MLLLINGVSQHSDYLLGPDHKSLRGPFFVLVNDFSIFVVNIVLQNVILFCKNHNKFDLNNKAYSRFLILWSNCDQIVIRLWSDCDQKGVKRYSRNKNVRLFIFIFIHSRMIYKMTTPDLWRLFDAFLITIWPLFCDFVRTSTRIQNDKKIIWWT